MQENRKENEHVKYLVFDVVAAVRRCDIPRQPCGVEYNTIRLPHKTQQIVVVEMYGCRTLDVKQALDYATFFLYPALAAFFFFIKV